MTFANVLHCVDAWTQTICYQKSVFAHSTGKTKKMACNFCKTAVADNGKNMTDHLRDCKKCPNDVKVKYCGTHTNNVVDPHLPPQPAPSNGSGSNASSSITCTPSSAKASETRENWKIPVSSSGRMGQLELFTDRTTPPQQSEIDTVLARAIFASGAPLSMTEKCLLAVCI